MEAAASKLVLLSRIRVRPRGGRGVSCSSSSSCSSVMRTMTTASSAGLQQQQQRLPLERTTRPTRRRGAAEGAYRCFSSSSSSSGGGGTAATNDDKKGTAELRRGRGPVPLNQTPRRAASSSTSSAGGSEGSSGSSGSSNNDGSSSATTATTKRSGPIPLNQTKRSAASKKVRSAADSTAAISTNGLALNGIVGTSNNSFSEPGFVGAPNGVGLQNFAAAINGGTPCDPAPPPFHLAQYGEESLYTLILLRHGESEWNSQNRYTGWCDVNLTKRGQMEARTAGRLLLDSQIEIDHAFTSVLKRASFSCNMALNTAQQHYVPVTKSYRLNERHYGALQGYLKDTAYQELGLDQELVMQMRRSYGVRPPRMEDDHPYWHGHDRRYKKLSPDQIERSRAESLADTADRIMPFYNSVIKPSLRSGNKCLVVSHANTIRTLIKHLDNISDQDIKGMTIPTGIPMLYRLNKNFEPVDPEIELEFRYMVEPKGYTWGTSRAHGFHGVYLGDLARLQDIQKKRDKVNRDWQRIILRNIGKSFGWDMEAVSADGVTLPCSGPRAVETRQLWWQVHSKMQNPDYSNMLLLVNMETHLEDLMSRKQTYITKNAYQKMCNKVHLDAAGAVVEPFVALADRQDLDQRQRLWYEHMTLDLEEESLIK